MHATATPSKTNGYTGPVIPLKHRPDCPTARELFTEIMAEQNFGPIERQLVRDKVATSPEEAMSLIEAFVQWYATGSVTKTKSFVMFEGDVDKVFHTMILNTPWYFDFCHTTTGVYTSHEPMAERNMSEEDIVDAAIYTTGLLEGTWGCDLSPHLRGYVEAVKAGNYVAASVSCPSNDISYDIVPK